MTCKLRIYFLGLAVLCLPLAGCGSTSSWFSFLPWRRGREEAPSRRPERTARAQREEPRTERRVRTLATTDPYDRVVPGWTPEEEDAQAYALARRDPRLARADAETGTEEEAAFLESSLDRELTRFEAMAARERAEMEDLENRREELVRLLDEYRDRHRQTTHRIRSLRRVISVVENDADLFAREATSAYTPPRAPSRSESIRNEPSPSSRDLYQDDFVPSPEAVGEMPSVSREAPRFTSPLSAAPASVGGGGLSRRVDSTQAVMEDIRALAGRRAAAAAMARNDVRFYTPAGEETNETAARSFPTESTASRAEARKGAEQGETRFALPPGADGAVAGATGGVGEAKAEGDRAGLRTSVLAATGEGHETVAILGLGRADGVERGMVFEVGDGEARRSVFVVTEVYPSQCRAVPHPGYGVAEVRVRDGATGLRELPESGGR